MVHEFKKSVLVIILSMAVVSFSAQHTMYGEEIGDKSTEIGLTGSIREDSYRAYLQKHSNVKSSSVSKILEASNYTEGEGVEVIQDYLQQPGKAIITGETGFVEYAVDIPDDGMYSMRVLYYPVEGKGTAIEREIRINGELPFYEARSVIFDRLWKDKGNVRKDSQGNEMRPEQEEAPAWTEMSVSDGGGYYTEPLQFYFSKGRHTLRLVSVREPMAIRRITIDSVEKIPVYSEVEKGYDSLLNAGNKLACKVQGEDAYRKSDPMLYPVCDRASPATEPASTSVIRLNTIGGSRWRIPGQWIEWKMNVPKDGLYKIALRARQNVMSGSFTSRALTIDGKTPFKEAAIIRFNYSGDWQIKILGDGNKPYLFELEEGEHVIRLETTPGEMANVLETVESSLLTLNACYRKILMITGPVPDPYRDYELSKEIPEVLQAFAQQAGTLNDASEYIVSRLGGRGENTAALDRLVRQLQEMTVKPDTIARRFEMFKENIGALGTWILTVREQPLEIDYLLVGEPEYTLPKAEAGIFKKLIHELRMFFAAFTSDFNSIGGQEGDKGNITVWTTAGREQAQIIRNMIDESFTPQSGIGVNLQVVAPGTLLPSVLAGKGPDMSLNVSAADAINFASRGALENLDGFSDYKLILDRFHSSALEPLSYEGSIYGLPETQTFPVMFYRKDILQELGLSVPKTWDDVYDILPEIQKQNMEFAVPLGMSSFGILLYQMGGEFYKNNGKASALDAEQSVMAFRKWTELFVNYKLPLQYDFANRFRTGEMPIGIADYTTYNMLMVFAPEIKGLWGFAPVVSMQGSDGKTNSYVPGNTTSCVLMESAKNKELSWEFMKWWTGTDSQVNYGREQESVMGAAARYPSANIEALKGLPWRADEIQTLEKQWENVRGIPEVPGGYYTPRYVDFAFRKVVLQGENARETLLDYVKTMNEEIRYKRIEFGLDLE